MQFAFEVTPTPDLRNDEVGLLIQGLNEQGRSSPAPFGVAVSAESSSSPRSFKRLDVRVAYAKPSSPSEIASRVFSHVASVLVGRGGFGVIRLGQVKVGVRPGAEAAQIAPLVDRLVQVAVEGAASLPSPWPDWPDPSRDARSLRQFVTELTGLTVVGIVEIQSIDGVDYFSARPAEGALLLGPATVGWEIGLTPSGSEHPTRFWQTAATPESLVVSLYLPDFLEIETPELAVEFRHIEFDPPRIERKFFYTSIGPVVVHTRKLGPDAPVEMAIEVKEQGRIFALPDSDFRTPRDLERKPLATLPF